MVKKIISFALVLCLITSCAIPDNSISEEIADLPAIQIPKLMVNRNQTTYTLKYRQTPAFLNSDTLVYCSMSKTYPKTVKVLICDVPTGNILNEKIFHIDRRDVHIDVTDEIIILNKSTGVLEYYDSDFVNTKTATLKNNNSHIESSYSNYYFSPDKDTIAYSLYDENKIIIEDLTNNEILSSEKYSRGNVDTHCSVGQILVNKNFCIEITNETEYARAPIITTQLINLLTKETELEYTERIEIRKVKGSLFLGVAYDYISPLTFNSYDEYINPIGPNFSDCVLIKPTPSGDIDIEFIHPPAGFEKSNVIVGENSEFILYSIFPDENYQTDYFGSPAFALRDPNGQVTYFDLPDNTDKEELYDFIYHSLYFLTLSPTGLRLANDIDDSIKIYDFETGEFTEIRFSSDKSLRKTFSEPE